MPRLRSRTIVSAPRQPGGRVVEADFAALTHPADSDPPGPTEEHSAERTNAAAIPTVYTHQQGRSRGPESDELAAPAADSDTHSAPHNSGEVTQAADVARDSTPTREHGPGSYDENGHYVPADCYKKEYARARQRVRWASRRWGTREALSAHFAFHGFLEYEALQEELRRLAHKEEERRINPKPKRVRPPRDETIPSDLAETEAPSDYSSSDSFEWETTPSDEEEASLPLVSPAAGAKRGQMRRNLAGSPGDLLDWSTQRSSLWTFPAPIASKAYRGAMGQ
ncbi:hypothetical protein FKP32DRAFT_1606308 [Trametes sanguinea]|nr:hypothetical protein FKP32DRAFT_1606308 [Trametes sanguinea]